MQTKLGNDGNLYMSLPNKDMVCRWVKVPESVINTDELWYKAEERLGKKWAEFKRTKVDTTRSNSKSKGKSTGKKSRTKSRRSKPSARK